MLCRAQYEALPACPGPVKIEVGQVKMGSHLLVGTSRNIDKNIHIYLKKIIIFIKVLFRDGMPSLSSSYNISGLVPACWLLF